MQMTFMLEMQIVHTFQAVRTTHNRQIGYITFVYTYCLVWVHSNIFEDEGCDRLIKTPNKVKRGGCSILRSHKNGKRGFKIKGDGEVTKRQNGTRNEKLSLYSIHKHNRTHNSQCMLSSRLVILHYTYEAN